MSQWRLRADSRQSCLAVGEGLPQQSPGAKLITQIRELWCFCHVFGPNFLPIGLRHTVILILGSGTTVKLLAKMKLQ